MATKVYRVRPPESYVGAATFYHSGSTTWFCDGVAYVAGVTPAQRLADYRYDEVGGNHDPLTNDIPAWYTAAVQTLARLTDQGATIADPTPSGGGATLRVLSPIVFTYCDTPEPWATDSVWFVEGSAFIPFTHPRATYYTGKAYTAARYDQAPVWWSSALTTLRHMPVAPVGPPTVDAATPYFRR